MTAPPQVQAQSFANAMRTDMLSHSSCAGAFSPTDRQQLARPHALKVQNKILRASALTTVYALLFGNLPVARIVQWLMSDRGTISRAIHYQNVNITG
jgi:hypothetical protein